jgi:hypothetical protein
MTPGLLVMAILAIAGVICLALYGCWLYFIK